MINQKEVLKIHTKVFLNILKGVEPKATNQDIVTSINLFCENIFTNSEDDINIDYEDVVSILDDTTEVYVTSLKTDDVANALKAISKDFNLDYSPIKFDKSIAIHFKLHPDFNFTDLSDAMDYIHEDVQVIIGTTSNNNKRKHDVEVSAIIAY